MHTSTKERDLLHRHGTRLVSLKPQNVVQAAEADLRLRARKSADEAAAVEPYAFHRDHVRLAKNARHLIALAAGAPALGVASGKYATRLIYESAALLRDALAIFGGGAILSALQTR